MAFIGSLVTTVKADTAPFRKGMTRAQRETEKLKGQIKGLASGALKLGGVLAALTTGALIAYTVQAFKAIDATAKLASEMEISTAKLTAYQLAAGLAGTDTATLNKALQRMARTVGEARSGITTGTKALEDFGIKVEDLQGLTTSQIFEEFAERISEIPDPLERAAKSALIFGKAGQKLLNFLSLGKDGLNEVQNELVDLGIAFDEVDARKVEQANDAMLKMTTVGKGLGNTLAISVAPFVERLATGMTDFIKASGGIDSIVKDSLTALGVGLGKTIDLLALAKGRWNAFTATARAGLALITFGDLSADLTKLAVEDLNEAEQAFKDFNNQISSTKVAEFFKNISQGAKETAEIVKEINGQKEFAIALTSAEARIMSELAAEQKKILETQKAINTEREKVIAAAQAIFNETRTPLEKIEAEIKRINELARDGLSDALKEGLERKLAELKKERENIVDGLGDDSGKGIAGVEGIGKDIKEVVNPLTELFKSTSRFAELFGKATDEATDPLQTRLGGFKQLDLKNVAIEGLTGTKNIEKETLEENKKTNGILNNILEELATGEKVAVAL
jgi:hypothetical protein